MMRSRPYSLNTGLQVSCNSVYMHNLFVVLPLRTLVTTDTCLHSTILFFCDAYAGHGTVIYISRGSGQLWTN